MPIYVCIMNTDRVFMTSYFYCGLLFRPKLNLNMHWGVLIINNWLLFYINAFLGLFGHLGISWYIQVLKGILWKCSSHYMVSEILNSLWVECISRKAVKFLPCLSHVMNILYSQYSLRCGSANKSLARPTSRCRWT